MSASREVFPSVSDGLSRLAAINAAMRTVDPDAQVALDPDSGRMTVLTVMAPEEVTRLLRELGEAAELLNGEDSTAPAGDNCCGCGCKHG